MSQHRTFFKSDMTPRVLEKMHKRQATEAHRRMVYRLVDERDQYRCRACGRRCRQTMEAAPERLEHHHLTFRSLGGQHHTANLVSLCLACHCEVTGHRLTVTGNPDQTLTFERNGSTWHG